jgi:hypothetical protein
MSGGHRAGNRHTILIDRPDHRCLLGGSAGGSRAARRKSPCGRGRVLRQAKPTPLCWHSRPDLAGRFGASGSESRTSPVGPTRVYSVARMPGSARGQVARGFWRNPCVRAGPAHRRLRRRAVAAPPLRGPTALARWLACVQRRTARKDRPPAAMKGGYRISQLGFQLSGSEFARPSVAGRPLAALRPMRSDARERLVGDSI